jgi:hypothetical protein
VRVAFKINDNNICGLDGLVFNVAASFLLSIKLLYGLNDLEQNNFKNMFDNIKQH